MPRSNKLADLTLVSKYYPVANYSYPRNEVAARHAAHASTSTDRSSLGSEGSAPGLIEDRTDSELSADDDYQYHAHTAELWDSFWKPEAEKDRKDRVAIHPKKQYPALIPSPEQKQRRRRHTESSTATNSGRTSPGWPLPDATGQRPRSRQAAATYSPFPKPIVLPPPPKPSSPSWQSSRPRNQPARPPRPDDRLLTPCIRQQHSPVTAFFFSYNLPVPGADNAFPPISPVERWPIPSAETTREAPRERASLVNPPPALPKPEEVQRPSTSQDIRPSTPTELPRPKTRQTIRPVPPLDLSRPKSSRSLRPESPTESSRPKSSRSIRPVSPMVEITQPETPVSSRPPTPYEPPSPGYFPSAAHFPLPEVQQQQPYLSAHQRSKSYLLPEPTPQSVFEDDSDCEEEGTRSFFRFHKRSGSDLRKNAKTTEPEAPRRRPHRSNTAQSVPGKQAPERKRHGVDVFGRMLGRRSR